MGCEPGGCFSPRGPGSQCLGGFNAACLGWAVAPIPGAVSGPTNSPRPPGTHSPPNPASDLLRLPPRAHHAPRRPPPRAGAQGRAARRWRVLSGQSREGGDAGGGLGSGLWAVPRRAGGRGGRGPHGAAWPPSPRRPSRHLQLVRVTGSPSGGRGAGDGHPASGRGSPDTEHSRRNSSRVPACPLQGQAPQ